MTGLLFIIGFVAGAAGLAEWAVRCLAGPPPSQIIRGGGRRIERHRNRYGEVEYVVGYRTARCHSCGHPVERESTSSRDR
jgi:hypothetical protein